MFRKKLSHITGKLRPDLDVRFLARPPPSVQHFFKTKDLISKHLQLDVVYSIKCDDCGDIYVGKTERQGARRLREYGAPKTLFKEEKLLTLNDMNNTGQPNNESDNEKEINNIKLPTGPLRRKRRKKAKPYLHMLHIRRSARIRVKQVTSNTINIDAKTERQDKSNYTKSKSLTPVS